MQNTTIIVAGGKGLRMKSDIPKQFLELDGRPVLMHTIEAFVKFDTDINLILVLPADQLAYWGELCKKHDFAISHHKVTGGSTRFESVKNGLVEAPDNGLIGVHDGVRPFIRPETIAKIYDEAAKFGNAIPAIAPSESIRIENENGSRIVDRATVRLIQTPQVFDAKALKEAYKTSYKESFTDDASVFETKHKIRLVEGQEGNIKITTPADL